MLWFSLRGESSLINQQVNGASKFNNCEVQINHCCQCWLRCYLFKTVKFKQQLFLSSIQIHTAHSPGHQTRMSPQNWASFLAVTKWGRRKEIELQPERRPILMTERSWQLQVNNSSFCQLCVRFHPWSWGWKADQALASNSSCTTGTSNTSLVVNLLTNNTRAWTMVCDHS